MALEIHKPFYERDAMAHNIRRIFDSAPNQEIVNGTPVAILDLHNVTYHSNFKYWGKNEEDGIVTKILPNHLLDYQLKYEGQGVTMMPLSHAMADGKVWMWYQKTQLGGLWLAQLSLSEVTGRIPVSIADISPLALFPNYQTVLTGSNPNTPPALYTMDVNGSNWSLHLQK